MLEEAPVTGVDRVWQPGTEWEEEARKPADESRRGN